MESGSLRHIAGILIVSPESSRIQEITRVTSHLSPTYVRQVANIREAQEFLYPDPPELIIIDLIGISEIEYLSKIEPFVLTLPAKVKAVLLEPLPTVSKVIKASEMGIAVMLRSISSHHGVTALMNEFRT